jgi:hypothetical protein
MSGVRPHRGVIEDEDASTLKLGAGIDNYYHINTVAKNNSQLQRDEARSINYSLTTITCRND